MVINGFNELLGRLDGILGIDDRARDGDAGHAGPHQARHVVDRDAANGKNRDLDARLLALRDDSFVAFKAQDRAQPLFGLREAEWPQADVGSALRDSPLDITEGVGRGAYQEGPVCRLMTLGHLVGPKDGHVLFPEMYGGRADLKRATYIVVNT